MNNTTYADLRSSPLSNAEQYAYALDNFEPSNFSLIPNIIDHLTYDEVDPVTGETTIKRLSVYSIQLYRIMRQIAGKENLVWKNSADMAELANMSEGQVVKSKRELQQKFHQLDGNSLISIVERKKTTKDNGFTYHQVHIRNIWNYNKAFFLLKKIEKEARSRNECANLASSPDEHASQGASSPGETNKTTCINIPLSEEQHSTAEAVSVVSSKKEEEIVDVGRSNHIEWLRKVGFTATDALNLVKTYTINELKAAANYIGYLKNKGQNIDNPLGYFRKTLENKWYERKS